jgi:hemolysin-activating ACP:hemolysin acyltransferase
MLEDAVKLWTTTSPYSEFRSATISWRLLPAILHNQIRLFYRDGECVGLITWAFMTRDEFESRDYSGEEIFSRDSGDVMVFVDMIAPRGRSDVLWMCREMRKQFITQYPEVREVLAHRGKRSGSFPNKGVWHENAA